MKKLLLVCAFMASFCHAQLVRFDSNITTSAKNVPVGAQAPVMTLPYAIITVCGDPAVGTPCTNTVPIFKDQAGTIPMDNPFTADAQGRFGFSNAGGNLWYSIQTPGSTPTGGYIGTYSINLSGGGLGVQPAPQHQETFYPNPGSQSTVSGDTLGTTDGFGNKQAVSQSLNGFNRPTLYGINLNSVYQPNPAVMPTVQAIVNNLNVSGIGYSYGPAAQAITGNWTTATNSFSTLNVYRPGITSLMGGNIQKYAHGDIQGLSCQPCETVGGEKGNSDQGINMANLSGGEIGVIYDGTITAGTARGATFINNTAGNTGGGSYMIDQTQTVTPGDFTGPPVLTDGAFYLAPIENGHYAPFPLVDMIPSTAAGILACPGGIPQLTDESVPQSVTCTVTAMADAPAGAFIPSALSDPAGTAAIAAGNPDIVHITSVSTYVPGTPQTVTFQYRHPNMTAWSPNGSFPVARVGMVWDGTGVEEVVTPGVTKGGTHPTWNNVHVGDTTTDGTVVWKYDGPINLPATLWQGGNIMATQMVIPYYNNTLGGLSSYFCFGATDAFHIGCLVEAGGVENTFPTTILPPVNLVSLTSVAGLVTGTVDQLTSDGQPYNGLQVGTVTGCSDANINGNASAVIYNINNVQLQWTNVNTGTYSCPNAQITRAAFYGAFAISPSAEQVSGPTLDTAGNPTAGALLGFNNVQFNAPDEVRQYHPSTYGGTVLFTPQTAFNPDSALEGWSLFARGPGFNSKFKLIDYTLATPCVDYVGCGGTVLPPSTLISLFGPTNGVMSGTMPLMGHAAFTFVQPGDFSVENCQYEQLFNLNPFFAGRNGNITFYPCLQEWDMATNTFTHQSVVNQLTVTTVPTPSAPSFGDTTFSGASNTALPNYVTLGTGAGDVTGQFGAGQIGAGLLVSGSTAPGIFNIGVIGPNGTTTACYETTAITTIGGVDGESKPGNSSCSSTIPNTFVPGSNYVILNFFPTLGANKFKAYKQDGGTYKLLCTVTIQQLAEELCTDTGQALGAAAPTADNSGHFDMLNGQMTANGISYIWPASEASGQLTNDGAGNLSWTPGGGGGSGFITSLTTTGTSGAASVVSGVLNIPQYSTTAFSALTSGTNTSAALVLGSGASLSATGSGSITATAMPYSGLTGSIPTWNQSTTGNAATATALASSPSGCSAGQAPTGILANGNATGCAAIGGGIVPISLALPSMTIAANTCTTPVGASFTGVATSGIGSHITAGFLGDPAAVVGFGGIGGLAFNAWATGAGTYDWDVCNQTASSITSSAITISLGAN